MTCEEALAYLESLEVLGIRPGLDRITALLDRLGRPQDAFPSVLIAGTNGKGSVAACLASILRRAGLEPGVYTSPHLVRFAERIVAGGRTIADDEVAALVPEVRAAIASVPRLVSDPPTYFEATTALAFLHFSRRQVPIAVLEVGMGGRFDATNVVRSLVCGITPVAMDHMQWLGDTLPEIAHQKAGILKNGVPAVVSAQQAPALEVIRAEAARVGAPLTLASACDVKPARGDAGESGGPREGGGAGRSPDPPVFSLTTPAGGVYPDLALSLRGAHQVENAVVAVLLAEQLSAGGVRGIDRRSIAAGLRGAVWPGRLEIIPGRPELLLDGAHNPAGCAALASYLKDHQRNRSTVLLFAAMKDKPAGVMLDLLCPLARKVIVTRVPVPRGETPEALGRLALERHPDVTRADAVAEALGLARDAAGPDGLVVISGSLYLVGEIKKVLSGQGRTESGPRRPG